MAFPSRFRLEIGVSFVVSLCGFAISKAPRPNRHGDNHNALLLHASTSTQQNAISKKSRPHPHAPNSQLLKKRRSPISLSQFKCHQSRTQYKICHLPHAANSSVGTSLQLPLFFLPLPQNHSAVRVESEPVVAECGGRVEIGQIKHRKFPSSRFEVVHKHLSVNE